MDSKAFYKLTYGLYIVSSAYEGKAGGCVVNTLAQVTSKPACMSVAINKDNYTTRLIEKSGVFAAVALAQEAGMDLIGAFGFKSSQDTDKFIGLNTKTDENGILYVAEQTLARYSCKIVNKLDLGTHIMFIGEVVEAEVLADGTPLTYTYYQTVKKGSTPKNAPSYKEEEAVKKGYRCSICGYIHESDTLPDDFVCPVCKATADKFEKL